VECGPSVEARHLPDGDATAYVRPHEVELTRADPIATGPAVVRSLSIIGPRTRLHIEHERHIIEVDADRSIVDALDLAPGRPVGLRFQTLRIFEAEKAG
jgi:sulfate transport system ATP-binding protein